nr:RNA polymerase sigma factor SigM [Lolliginicoccus suaedae]
MRHIRGVATTGMSDRELIAAHVSGDTQAFAELIHRHQRYLWRVAKRTSHCDEDAADALQEAMLSAFRMAEGYRADAAVRSWLHRIVVNSCLDRMRRNRVRPAIPLDPSIMEHVGLIGDRPSGDDIAEAIDHALMLLPAEQRAAVVTVDVEGYPVAEAAEVLGIPIGTVKSRCARGRLKLAEILSEFHPERNRSAFPRVNT